MVTKSAKKKKNNPSKKKIILGVLFCLLLLFFIFNYTKITYLASFVIDQLTLVSQSEKISEVIKENSINPAITNQLKLVPTIMTFGDQLGFPQTDSYSHYITLNRETFQYSLSASRKDKFEQYYWSWPFIGKLPYKGFIDKKDALAEKEQLNQQGYDTSLGKSSAMSTLGLLSDPIITTMININDSTKLIMIIYHERTHQLFFRKNDVTFNENAAELIGKLTALEFIKQQFGEESIEYKTHSDRMHDLLLFSAFLDQSYQELDTLYKSDVSVEEKLKQREVIFQQNIVKYKELEKKLRDFYKGFDQEEMNNAYILAEYTYDGRVYEYYKVYEKLGGNLPRTIQFFRVAAQGEEEPEVAIKRFLEE